MIGVSLQAISTILIQHHTADLSEFLYHRHYPSIYSTCINIFEMPLVTLHLISLAQGVSIASFLKSISYSDNKPLVVSRAIRWIIKPEKLSFSPLLNEKWDLLLIYPKPSPLIHQHFSNIWISNHFTLTAGVPGSLIEGFDRKNERLLHPRQGDVPELTGALSNPRKTDSAQALELNDELQEWSKTFELGKGAVSMLNLLAFNPGPEAHESYQKYGKGFAESAGAKRGGQAKLVGKVVDDIGWDEIALAHYPSINHFTDMLASDDYQKINHEYRLPVCSLATGHFSWM